MSAPTAETLAEALRPLTEAPDRAAVLCDVDGTIAPIVERADDAQVPDRAARILAALAGRYACVACISGRAAADARRLVGVGRIAYAGAHGAELLEPGERAATAIPAFATWREPIRRFSAEHDSAELRRLRVRIEDKGPIAAFHWRGAPDEDEARTRVEAIAQEAEAAGLATHWGRKVLEVRPPVPISKGRAVSELVRRSGARAALYGGDDATDLDGFDALDSLLGSGDIDSAVRVGVASEEGPPEIVERADLAVGGPAGFVEVLAALAGSS
ncbi:MAG TPA: trehalose-phosphatase [Thermoleophilaceae bacterium]